MTLTTETFPYKGRALPALLLLAFCFSGCTPSASGRTDAPDEHPIEAPLPGDRHMVSAANPHAVEIGRTILRAGGNAVDAAVAVKMALTVVEAPETGIGGGGFLLYRDGATGEMSLYDGRETAPLGATPERFTVWGVPMPHWMAVVSGRSVGVPGMVAMLKRAHRDHGSLPWSDLVEPAVALAQEGIPIPPRLQEQIASDYSLRIFSETRDAFVRPWRLDDPVLRNPELARTLRLLAEDPEEVFYRGALAEQIVEAARSRRLWPSEMTAEDMSGYAALVREPVCGPYRTWTVCGAPPPSSGGIAVLQILGILEHFDLAALEPGSAAAIHLIAEASRLAFADRNHYIGDPAFVEVPTEALLSRAYLAERAALIRLDRALKDVVPGGPDNPSEPAAAAARVDAGGDNTSHLSIVDAAGNVVSLTGSIEAPFGSRIMAGGFLLNNQLTDFSFRAQRNGRPHPNAVAAGKRPRSSMSPTIVLDDEGEVRLVIGSRGGSRIIGYVVKAVVGVLDWEMSVQQAVALPNFVHRGEALEIEKGSALEAQAAALEALGHTVRSTTLTSGLHGIERIGAQWRGGADPRLDGTTAGD